MGNKQVLSNNDKKILELLECLMCNERLIPPIYQCKKGHALCNRCLEKIKRCPICRNNPVNLRSRVLDRLAEESRVDCMYRASGCQEMVKYVLKQEHEAKCLYKPVPCLYDSECLFEGTSEVLQKHLFDVHGYVERKTNKVDVFKWLFGRGYFKDTWQCKAPLIDNQTIVELLQCPVCIEGLKAPIFQCKEGHILCRKCIDKIEVCPSCRSTPLDNRCHLLEGLAKSIEVDCMYRANGCTLMVKYLNKEKHESECRYNPCWQCGPRYELNGISGSLPGILASFGSGFFRRLDPTLGYGPKCVADFLRHGLRYLLGYMLGYMLGITLKYFRSKRIFCVKCGNR